MGWRKLSESMPPIGSEVFLLEPIDSPNPHEIPLVWKAFVSESGMVEFCLPWDMVSDYSVDENLDFMADRLKRCTHWAPVFDLIVLPEIA